MHNVQCATIFFMNSFRRHPFPSRVNGCYLCTDSLLQKLIHDAFLVQRAEYLTGKSSKNIRHSVRCSLWNESSITVAEDYFSQKIVPVTTKIPAKKIINKNTNTLRNVWSPKKNCHQYLSWNFFWPIVGDFSYKIFTLGTLLNVCWNHASSYLLHTSYSVPTPYTLRPSPLATTKLKPSIKGEIFKRIQRSTHAPYWTRKKAIWK